MRGANEADQALVRKAYDFAKKAHEGHVRYSGEPYFTHPAAVAKHLAEIGLDARAVAAGLLHDSVEDAKATEEDISKEFGDEVRCLVEGVTKLGRHKYRGLERHAESLRRLLVATAADVRVLIIKLMDRYHNMFTLEHVPEEKRRRIALETLEIYAPIADRLGMGKVKRDLEDLAFPWVDPDAFAHAGEVRKLKRKENEEELVKVQKTLRKTLAHKGIKKFRTDIRIKGLWSLHQKLKRKQDDITKIHDIAALRVIVTSIEDCYAVLGIIHSLWKPLPGEFKDYIAFPKPNGYQSLHTTVITSEAGIVETQVRTEQMHRDAQFGIASHMSYKSLGKAAPKSAFERLSFSWILSAIPSLLGGSKSQTPETGKKTDPSPRWLAEIADAHAEVAGSKEFLAGLKEDLFSHRIFVFTPKGDVIDLPAASTPIDFAYAIHGDLGNRMRGAKVNGKLVALDTALGNGDVVEIVTRDNAHPTAKWLEAAKTSLARKHIRSALGFQEPESAQKGSKSRKQKKKGKKSKL